MSVETGVVIGCVVGSGTSVLLFAIAYEGDGGDDEEDGDTSHSDADEGANR